MSGSPNAVDLADTHMQIKTFLQEPLNDGTWRMRSLLACLF